MTVKLHSTRVGSGPPVVLVHGLFGAGGNLGMVARSLQDRYEVHCVDLPNHGRSSWLDDASLEAMAESLDGWMQHHNLQSAVFLGHSLGGKVAMQLALTRPRKVEALVVADIAPVAYPSHHDSVFEALEAVAEAGCDSRPAAAAIMEQYLREPEVIQFLLMSLQRGEQGVYNWRFNLQGLKRNYSAVRVGLDSAAPYPGPVLFIKGGESSYIQESHRSHILALFPAARVKVMPASGHWLHAQHPSLFNGIVGRFLDAQTS